MNETDRILSLHGGKNVMVVIPLQHSISVSYVGTLSIFPRRNTSTIFSVDGNPSIKFETKDVEVIEQFKMKEENIPLIRLIRID